MLNRIARYVDAVNIDRVSRRIRDVQLPNGLIDMEPGVVTAIPAPVWARCWRLSWIKRASDVVAPEPAEEVIEVDEPVVEEVVEEAQEKRKAGRPRKVETHEND